MEILLSMTSVLGIRIWGIKVKSRDWDLGMDMYLDIRSIQDSNLNFTEELDGLIRDLISTMQVNHGMENIIITGTYEPVTLFRDDLI